MSCSGLICFNNNTGWVWTPSKPINWQYKHDTRYAHKWWLHIKAHGYHISVDDTEIPVRSHSRLRMYIGTPDTHMISLSHLQIYNAFNHVDNRQIGAITHTFGVSGEGGGMIVCPDDTGGYVSWRICLLVGSSLLNRLWWRGQTKSNKQGRRGGEESRCETAKRAERNDHMRAEMRTQGGGYSGENNKEESREEMTGEGTEERTKKRYEIWDR